MPFIFYLPTKLSVSKSTTTTPNPNLSFFAIASICRLMLSGICRMESIATGSPEQFEEEFETEKDSKETNRESQGRPPRADMIRLGQNPEFKPVVEVKRNKGERCDRADPTYPKTSARRLINARPGHIRNYRPSRMIL